MELSWRHNLTDFTMVRYPMREVGIMTANIEILAIYDQLHGTTSHHHRTIKDRQRGA